MNGTISIQIDPDSIRRMTIIKQRGVIVFKKAIPANTPFSDTISVPAGKYKATCGFGQYKQTVVLTVNAGDTVVYTGYSPPTPKWTFIISGDSQHGDAPGEPSDDYINTIIFPEIVAAVVAENPDLFLLAGDLIAGYQPDQTTTGLELTQWLTYAQPLYDAGIIVRPIRGNHDANCANDMVVWNNYFADPTNPAHDTPTNGPTGEVGATYSFTYNNAFFMGIDQFTYNVPLGWYVNQPWIDSQFAALDSATTPHVFVFGHSAPFAVHHTDSIQEHPTERDALWLSIKNAGGRIHFSGHDHQYSHQKITHPADNGWKGTEVMHAVVAGSSGGTLYPCDAQSGGGIGGQPVNNGEFTVSQVANVSNYGYTVVTINYRTVTVNFKQRTSPGVYTSYDTFSWTV